MKKILGISAVVLLLGASAFGGSPSSPPYISYFLQLGGNDGAATYKSTGTGPEFVAGSEADGQPVPSSGILTWSVRVEAGGSQPDLTGNTMYVGGVANAVWDLQLIGPDGKLVGDAGSVNAPFGLGSATVPGFFSAINDGTSNPGGPDPLEAAAFTWVYKLGSATDPARIFDPAENGANGPHLSRMQYPSTYLYPNNVAGQRPGVSTAKSGTLMGMGAGYEQYSAGNTERGGVGLTDSTYMCTTVNVCIAEGQINTSGLAGGTYTLALIPGKGNNVIWNNSNDCSLLSGGAFAIGVSDAGTPCANLCGDTITFTVIDTKGHVIVNLTPPTAGQWSVDGGTTWLASGAKADIVPPGAYTVTFKSTDPCWAAPAPITGNVAAGVTDTKSAAFTAVGSTLVVNLGPAAAITAGAAWSIDAGATWNQVGSLAVPAGSYTVTFKAGVPGWDKPADAPVTLACGQTSNPVNGIYVVSGCVQAPIIASAVSRKAHGATSYDIPCIGYGTPTVECRANGVTQMVVTFDRPVIAEAGGLTPAIGTAIVATGGTATGASIAGNVLTITLTTANQNGSMVSVLLHGIACNELPNHTPAGVMADAKCCIVALRGDVTGNGAVDIGDINAVKAASGSALNATNVMFRRDVTANGAIDIGDINNVKSLSGTGFQGSTCP